MTYIVELSSPAMAVWTMDRLRIAVIMSVDVLQLLYHPGAEEPKDS